MGENPKSEIRNIAGWCDGIPNSELRIPHSEFMRAYHPSVTVEIRIRRLPHAEDLPWPAYATDGAAGADLCAAVESELILKPGERALSLIHISEPTRRH